MPQQQKRTTRHTAEDADKITTPPPLQEDNGDGHQRRNISEAIGKHNWAVVLGISNSSVD